MKNHVAILHKHMHVALAEMKEAQQAVYRLSPPMPNGTEYVLVSALSYPDTPSEELTVLDLVTQFLLNLTPPPGVEKPASYGESETVIFPCDEEGNCEEDVLAAVKVFDHPAALREIGYASAEVN